MDEARAADGGGEGGTGAVDIASSVVDPCAATRIKVPTITWLQPAKGTQTVCEQGIEYTLSVRCESEAVTSVTFTLCDASTYSSWCVPAPDHPRHQTHSTRVRVRAAVTRCGAAIEPQALSAHCSSSPCPRASLNPACSPARRWSETVIAKAVPVVDGVCRTQWRVRRDLPLSDTYVLSARSMPAGLAEAQVRHPRNGLANLHGWPPTQAVCSGAPHGH